jgi:hypothetical protein
MRAAAYRDVVEIVGASSEDEMIACFLRGELASERFGPAVRQALAAAGLPAQLVTNADLTDETGNHARRELLGATRGYGQNRDLFDEDFPVTTSWSWAVLTPGELARVRYVHDDYWNELSGGSRLALDAAERIRAGRRAFDVPNDRFIAAQRALARGEEFPPLVLVGTRPESLVCLEGNLRLTAWALAGFPAPVRCLVGIDPGLARWTHSTLTVT